MTEQNGKRRSRRQLRILLLLGACAAVVAVLVRLWRRLRPKTPPPERRPPPPIIHPDIRGLTEAEAEARRLEGQDNTVQFAPLRSRKQILRDNVFTIFNFSLLGMAGVQLLLRQPWDALISLGVATLNISMNVVQELLARKALRKAAQAARPQATVIREGRARSVDPDEVVRGDVLVVGPGDQFLADGEVVSGGPIVVDQSTLTDEDDRPSRSSGDMVYAGSLCVSGRAAYEAQSVGNDRLVATLANNAQPAGKELTPLERIISRVLYVLLALVAVLTAVILIKYFQLDTPVDVEPFIGAASIVFSLAPAGLYFMIFLSYVVGTADLARAGALVHRARSVESLAQASILCFTQSAFRPATQVTMEPVEPAADQERLAQSRIHQILGGYARSSSVTSQAVRAMREAFEGERRAVLEEAPFLSVYGWSAIEFDDDDLRGIYVLGDPKVMGPHLRPTSDDEPADDGKEQKASPLSSVRNRLSSFGRFFRRSAQTPQEEDGTEPQHQEIHLQPTEVSETIEATPTEETPKRNLLRRATGWAKRILPRRQKATQENEPSEDAAIEEMIYLFAYSPELAPLHNHDGLPRLPEKLIPMCHLHYTEQIRPETVDTIRSFADTGVVFKFFSSGTSDRVVALLERAGLSKPDGSPLSTISGTKLGELDSEGLSRAAAENSIFDRVTSEQTRQVVEVLAEQGAAVTVVGDGVNDLPAMHEALLSVARQDSSQAALGAADIVLLEDASQGLPMVLKKGQRIVNGLLDVLKIFLTQVSYLAVLILIMWAMGLGLPYDAKQGSIIAIFTLTLPALALSLWAVSGVSPRTDLSGLLARFVAPAAISISAAALAIYLIFLQRAGEPAYAQLAVTHLLVFSGLALVILIRPPIPSLLGGNWRSVDRRFTALVAALLVLFFLASWLPITYRYFLLTHLRQPADYLIIGLAVLAWVFVVRFVWLLVPVERSRDVSSLMQ